MLQFICDNFASRGGIEFLPERILGQTTAVALLMIEVRMHPFLSPSSFSERERERPDVCRFLFRFSIILHSVLTYARIQRCIPQRCITGQRSCKWHLLNFLSIKVPLAV